MLPCHVRRSGTGGRRAHLIHCNLASGKAWEPLTAQFLDDLSMTAVDMLGQGRSPDPARDRDYQWQCAEASIAVLEADGAGPQDLVGHSFGATVALRVASLRPDLVRSLVLFEPIMFGFLGDVGHPAWDVIAATQDPFYTAYAENRLMDAAEDFLTNWGMPGAWAAMDEATRQGFADRMWLIAIQREAIIGDNDWRLRPAELGRMEMPALVMHGEDSPDALAALTEIISDGMPKGQGAGLAGAGHMLPLTHPQEVASHMRRFWGMA